MRTRRSSNNISFTFKRQLNVVNVSRNDFYTEIQYRIHKYKISFVYQPQIGWIAKTLIPRPLEAIADKRDIAANYLIHMIHEENKRQRAIDKTFLKLLDMRRHKNGTTATGQQV